MSLTCTNTLVPGADATTVIERTGVLLKAYVLLSVPSGGPSCVCRECCALLSGIATLYST